MGLWPGVLGHPLVPRPRGVRTQDCCVAHIRYSELEAARWQGCSDWGGAKRAGGTWGLNLSCLGIL